MKSGLISAVSLIISIIFVVQLVSADILLDFDVFDEGANYISDHDYPNPIYSISEALNTPPPHSGSVGLLVGRTFCTRTGSVLVSFPGSYEYKRVLSGFQHIFANAIVDASIQIREMRNGEAGVGEEPISFIQIFAPAPLGPNPANSNPTTDNTNGPVAIPAGLILSATLDTCGDGTTYSAGVYVHSEVNNGDMKNVGQGYIYAKSKLSRAAGSTGIQIAEVGCGVTDENTPSIAKACGKSGCNIVLSASYIGLNIPENALEGEVSFINGISGNIITIYKFENNEQPGLVSPLYYITPTDLTLNLPATITIGYNESLVNNEDEIFIATLDDRDLIKIETESIDKENNRITAKIDNFGYFVVVEDKTPPRIELNTYPTELWPPNNKPVDVTIKGFVIDDITGVDEDSLKLVVDNKEKEINVDDYGNFNVIVPLIAKRAGQEKQGHIYNIELTAADNAGNTAITGATVLVPHDQRR